MASINASFLSAKCEQYSQFITLLQFWCRWGPTYPFTYCILLIKTSAGKVLTQKALFQWMTTLKKNTRLGNMFDH